MKITVKEEEKEEKEYSLADYEKGTVFEFNNGVTAVVILGVRIKEKCIQGGKSLLLLDYGRGGNWFQIAKGFLVDFEQGKFKVLGKIQEVIVG